MTDKLMAGVPVVALVAMHVRCECDVPSRDHARGECPRESAGQCADCGRDVCGECCLHRHRLYLDGRDQTQLVCFSCVHDDERSAI